MADELVSSGKFSIPTFGWSVAPITATIAAEFGLPAGMFVRTLTAGGPAAAAGITDGDVITEVGGHPATDEDTLTRIALAHKTGDQVAVTYHRAGHNVQTKITLS